MDSSSTQPDASPGDPRVYFAAERNLLAWIRTGLAMMGFGFVMARFALFLREAARADGVPNEHRIHISLIVGIILVIVGVCTSIFAVVGHWKTLKRLDAGHPLHFSPFSLGVIVSLILAGLGALIALYLMIEFQT